MKDFENIKNKVKELFRNRKGFTDDVLDSITAIYLYLFRNFTEIVPYYEIPDNNSFKIESSLSNGRSIANIFINRIYNNVLTITSQTSATGQYFPKKKMIAISPAPHILHTYNYLNLSKEQLNILEQNLKAKVITHELLHAGSDNGTLIGFFFRADKLNEHKNYINAYYSNSSQSSGESIMMEEMLTEVLALNIVGINTLSTIFSQNKKYNFQIECRNINSSNAPINPLGEYFIRTFENVTYGKFTNGFKWLSIFSENNEYFKTTKTNFIYKFNNYLRFIANYYKTTTISYAQKSLKLIKKVQFALLDYYIDNLQISTEKDCKKSIKDYVAFSIFAIKENNCLSSEIATKLNYLKNIIAEYSKNFNLDFNQIATNEYINISGKDLNGNLILNKPYSNILSNKLEFSANEL